MSNLTLLFVFIVFTLLGCGGGKNKSTASTPPVGGKVTTKITTFNIIGSSDADNGVIPINAGIDNGKFKVEWEVISSENYDVDLYLSNDKYLSDKTDIVFSALICGSTPSSSPCTHTASLDCKFSSTNKISCGSNNQEKDLSSFLNALPQQAFIIIEVCDSSYKSCKVSSQAVELN